MNVQVVRSLQQLLRATSGALVVAAACCVGAQSYYGSYYQPPASKPFASAAGQSQGQPNYLNPTRDLYNKYYYQRPSISPYLNLDRPLSGASTSYQTWVRPEQQRREREAQQQAARIATRKQQPGYSGMTYGAPGTLGAGSASPSRPNAYYGQWYGNNPRR